MDDRRAVVEIDLSEVRTEYDLHVALARALEFPDFYGKNWAAFWDGITGLVMMPRRLRLRGWGSLATRLPEQSRMLQSCLNDMAREHPKWAAEVEYA